MVTLNAVTPLRIVANSMPFVERYWSLAEIDKPSARCAVMAIPCRMVHALHTSALRRGQLFQRPRAIA